MPRINKLVPIASLLIFITISAVACGIYTQMAKERVYGLKQSITDIASVVASTAKYRRSVTINLINTLDPTEERLLAGLCTAYTDSVSPSYLYNVDLYLASSDECTQVKEFEKSYCANIMQVARYRHVKNTGFTSFDGKTFVHYPYLVTRNRSLVFLPGLEHFSLLLESLVMDGENLMFSLFKNGKSVTGDEYNARNVILTVSGAMEHFFYLLIGLYAFVYKKDVYFQVCTLTIFFATLMAVISGASCLYLVRKVINRDIVEKEAIINNHFEHVPDGGLFFSAADVKKLYSMYNSAFLDDLTKAMGRKSFDEDLRALPEKGGYLCLFDIDKFKNTNDTFGHSLGDEVLMKVAKTLRSQISVGKGKVYRFGGDESTVIYTGDTLEELLSTLKEIVYSQVGSINLSTSIGVMRPNKYITTERLKMLTDEWLYKSKENGRTQISW